MNSSPQHNYRLCPKCGFQNLISDVTLNTYRCMQCDQELAHIELAANGSVRGIFGWLREVEDVIGERYQIRTVLGKGGAGATYLVEDLRVKGKRWALKEIPEVLFDESEATLLSSLDHPSIPIIADRFNESGMVYLVLKFGGTRTLATECKRRGRIELVEVKTWVLQIGRVLNYLHSRHPPIIHRDLKPENILLDDEERVMLIDFGIARKKISDDVTQVLGRAVSLGFSPPEQILGIGTDLRSDIYSLAATTYFSLTGHPPTPAHDRLIGKPLISPQEINGYIPDAINSALITGLNLNVNERPQTVDEFLSNFSLIRGRAEKFVISEKTMLLSDIQFPQTTTSHSLNNSPQGSLSKKFDKNADRPPVKSFKLIAGFCTFLFFAVLGSYWVWHAMQHSSPTETKGDPIEKSQPTILSGINTPEKQPIERVNEAPPPGNEAIPSNTVRQVTEANDLNKSPVKPVMEPPKISVESILKEHMKENQPIQPLQTVKGPAIAASKGNSTQLSSIQPKPEKKTSPSSTCQSLTESYKLGDPSISQQRLRQACSP